MSRLIDELLKEHAALTQGLKQISEVGISSTEGRQRLAAIKLVLLEHLAKEDAKLYPPLREKARTDSKLAWTLDFFAKDLQEVSAVANAFFERYSGPGGDAFELAHDYGTLVARVKERVRKEEYLLFPAYRAACDE
jgi:hypothetical protein